MSLLFIWRTAFATPPTISSSLWGSVHDNTFLSSASTQKTNSASFSVPITLRSTSVHETHLPCNLLLISSQMLSCQLKGNLKLSLPFSLLHLLSFMIIGHKTITLPSPAPVSPVPPFIQAVAYIHTLITQSFFAQYLKSMDTIQLLICTAGLCLDCCSVLSPSFPKHYFASLPPNYFLVGGSLWTWLFSQPVLLNSSSLSLSPLLQ